jgi:hypothetical protein
MFSMGTTYQFRACLDYGGDLALLVGNKEHILKRQYYYPHPFRRAKVSIAARL